MPTRNLVIIDTLRGMLVHESAERIREQNKNDSLERKIKELEQKIKKLEKELHGK